MKPFIVKLSPKGKHQEILNGPPKTKGFYSGLVTLKPGAQVHPHSTKHFEEVLVVFQGKGKAFCQGHRCLNIAKGNIVYIPPHTKHHILNTGKAILRYLYLVKA
ncbi:cupin domain-containing protein [Elusimicrobiota bacterium]